MNSILPDLTAGFAFILFAFIHLITGVIRGVYRYQVIKKYQYDYYDQHPLNLLGRIRHNLYKGTFALRTFYVSVSITSITLLATLGIKYS